MPRRTRLITSTIVVLVLAVLALVTLSDNVFPFTEPLRVSGRVINESERHHEYVVRFQSNGNTHSATVTIDVRSSAPDRHMLRANIVHEPDTRIESFEFMFVIDGDPDALALRTPGGYPWPPISYHVSSDGRSVLVGASDLGVQGEGSLTLDFLLDDALTVRSDDAISIGIVFELRDDGLLKLTKHRAETTVDVQVPMTAQ